MIAGNFSFKKSYTTTAAGSLSGDIKTTVIDGVVYVVVEVSNRPSAAELAAHAEEVEQKQREMEAAAQSFKESIKRNCTRNPSVVIAARGREHSASRDQYNAEEPEQKPSTYG